MAPTEGAIRRWIRSIVPASVRLTIAVLRRGAADLTSRARFASKRTWRGPAHAWGTYALPLTTYAGQEHTAEAKRQNTDLLVAALDRSVVQPGELWSLWRLAGAPTRAKGYGEAAAIIDGELTTAIGGSTCLVSTVVFNAGLLAGLELAERTAHSVDTYEERRYFELGQDATIEYGYLDLRFRNDFPWPLVLQVSATADGVHATFAGAVEQPFEVKLTVEVDRSELDGIRARTTRTRRGGGLPTQVRSFGSSYRRLAATSIDDALAELDTLPS
jgi:hypothetical protein